ncbi:hypothetical protein [Streptomyces sp. CAU 1734]|uniref:hypothetical protein n=1 Tax=Streptomyces sp. CAU 1734 TaxID=3140360 RepID=UPI003260A9A9
MSAAERVTRYSFADRLQRISLPRPLSVLPARIWSAEEWERIQLGHGSGDMDEKWDVFAEGTVVFLHRSWTGRGIFEAAFTTAGDEGGRQITEAVVERDQGRYRSEDDEYDCLLLELVISSIVLGEPARALRSRLAEFTRRAGGAEVPAGLVQHSVLGLRSDS